MIEPETKNLGRIGGNDFKNWGKYVVGCCSWFWYVIWTILCFVVLTLAAITLVPW